ncbi:protein OBERON 3-like isoform X2 [Aristolochia californica]|uniref:protein OBERON 3-like isoform X2 n=1 Tax=Aristolochia californica TaxID=171875 RepID=UPI0035E36DF2
MFVRNDLPNGFSAGPENLSAKPKSSLPVHDLEDRDEKMEFLVMASRLLPESDVGNSVFSSRPSKMGSQELTLSYLCDNPKLGILDKEASGTNLLGSLERGRYKGKEVASDSPEDNHRWVERDFLQLNENKGSKRGVLCGNAESDGKMCEKKPKIEALNLSLALPDVSLSLASSNPVPNPKNTHSVQSWAPSTNNTRTSSDDFTASLSYSYPHQLSHNPSCSLTRNSTENYEYSIGSVRRETDQIWYCGEGTNGSVHSRFKPAENGVNFSNHTNRNNNLYRTTSSENHSFFPTELPARPRKDAVSSDSRGKALVNSDTGPDKILRDIVCESVPVMAQILQEVTNDTLDAAKEHLKSLLVGSEKREEFANLQRRLERRSDLTAGTLSKCHKVQLDVLSTIKTGVVDYIVGKTVVPTNELIEIFLLSRCRNINCKSVLPVDDCDCKICSTKKGFCSTCMCPICMNFDCASNTCSWVGCDVCSHWCHAICGIQMNLIRPGQSSKGSTGTTEMQFNCLGCGHASELFGFVKEAFMSCAKGWGLETLIKELDCVRKIFHASRDLKEKELHNKAEELLSKLKKKLIIASDACNEILLFFKYGGTEFSNSGSSSKELAQMAGPGPRVEVAIPPPISDLSSLTCNISKDTQQHIQPSKNERQEKKLEPELRYGILKKDEFDSLETIVRIKEAEARMFQSKADDARREAEGYGQLVRVKSEKLEEEYTGKLAKLCLQETEERRRKKLEDLNMLENSQCDYYKMKLRMEADIAGLLERMEATKQQLVRWQEIYVMFVSSCLRFESKGSLSQ